MGEVAGAESRVAGTGGAGSKVLVAYYTRSGRTKQVAEELASRLGADLERILDYRPRSMGFLGYMNCGRQASFGLASRIKDPVRDPADYDRVAVLTPVWAWKLSPPVRSWLRLMRGRLPASVFVTVSGGTEPERIAAEMAAESGLGPLGAVGFVQADFAAENKGVYEEKIAEVLGTLN